MIRKIFFLSQLILVILAIGCSSEKAYLPENIYNLTLSKRMVGEEAKEFIDKMHFQKVASIENEIGFYDGPKGPAVIYVSHYENQTTAEGEWQKMTEKISTENSVFIGGENINLNGQQVYRCFGLGQTHFVFTDNSQLIWMSVDTLSGKTILTEYLEYLDL